MDNDDEARGPPDARSECDHGHRCPVVAIGASAGGLEALEQFFRYTPAEPGASFIVITHLSPSQPSTLPELLAKATPMRVRHAADEMPVEPNQVMVMPPNADMAIRGGVLSLTTPAGTRRAPIDAFFRSLAEDVGRDAVGIVLSGTGSDGALGIRAIKEHGGMTMAQSAGSAKYDSMPRSAIALGLVDFILPVEELPDRLVDYLTHLDAAVASAGAGASTAERGAALDEALLQKILRVLQRNTGHDFTRYKRTTLIRRLHRRMQVLHVAILADYLDLLDTTPSEADALFRDLLIGVTQFFRDHEAFAALARDVIPRVLDGKGPEEPLRIWVPGCATGEEAYSIAILLREAPPCDTRPIKIFATDIDDAALDTARAGRYSEIIADRVSAERLERFFLVHPGGYQVRKEIRDLCVFSTHNVLSDPPFSGIDLISCRNLLIYLESDAQKAVFPLFHYALRPGGYLFLGPSENVTVAPDLFSTVLDPKHRIFQRKEVSVPVRFPLGVPSRMERHAAERPHARWTQARDRDSTRLFERILLSICAPPAVIVDDSGGIVFVSGRTGKYLELAPGAANVNLVEMTREGIRPDLHTALHKALRTREEVTQQGVLIDADGRAQRVDMKIRPLHELGAGAEYYAVIFQDVGEALSKEQAEAQGLAPRAGDTLAQALESELRATKEHLQTTIGELESSNEELRSTNEEMLSTNEELQSANEELQTSREELQSINEELQTVNTELSRKVEELDRSNSDLQNLFASTRIPTIFLSNQLVLKKFSPAAKEIFRLIDTDVSRPITDIVPMIEDNDLGAEVGRVLATLEPSERQLRKLDEGAWYLRRISPYRSLENVIDGVVVTFVDISELKRALERAGRLAAIVESSHDAILGMTLELEISTWNRGAELMLGHAASEVVGQLIDRVLTPDAAKLVRSSCARVVRGERVEPIETTYVRKDGSLVDVLVSLSPVVTESNHTIGLASIARDVTDRNRTARALITEREQGAAAALADRRKSEFLAVLAHELRNPLAPIRNAVHVLQEAAPVDASTGKARDIIARQVAHMTRLIDDLLDLSRIASGKIVLQRERLDVVELVRTVAGDHRAAAEAAGLAVELDLPDQPVWVLGDAVRLSQSVGNLLGNAIKFSIPGGRVGVGVEPAPEGGAVAIRVRDTGIGMDAEMLAHAFEPFAQAPGHAGRGGLGLGLPLVRAMVALHGGTVEARSDGPGRGSELTIRLGAEPEGPAADAAERPDGRRRRVLVIEDNEDAAETMQMLLQMFGHEVTVARSGGEGITVALARPPDVILCDLTLSGDVDGYGVARALRANPATTATYLVAVTGHGMEEDQRRTRDAGFDLHLIKPVDPGRLQQVVASAKARA